MITRDFYQPFGFNTNDSFHLHEAEIVSKLDKAKTSLQLSKERLKKITNQSQQKTLNEAKEDECSSILRNWCLKVRSEVLVPAVDTQSETTRPPASGIMPPIMIQVIAEAVHFGIFDISDIKKMVECFRSICWSFSAMVVIRRKPSLSEVRHLISEASEFKLPVERALRTMKFMANKASQLQSKIEKALCAEKGESKPMNVSILKELESGTRESPLVVPEEAILRVVIQGNGDVSDRKLILESCVENQMGPHSPSIDLRDDVSPYAPDPMKLWPPFGLLHSQTAIQTFGSDCLAVPDVTSTHAAKRNEVLSGCSSSSEAFTPKGITVSSEVHDQEESIKINEPPTASVQIKKLSPEPELRNDTSQDYTKSCSSATPNSHAERNEVLSGCSSSSEAITPKGITVSSEVHDREESFKINEPPTTSVQIKKLSPEPELRSDTSQLDKKTCYSATPEKVSWPSFLQNGAKITHHSGQPTTDLPIPPDTSSSTCHSETQLETEVKSSNSNEAISKMVP